MTAFDVSPDVIDMCKVKQRDSENPVDFRVADATCPNLRELLTEPEEPFDVVYDCCLLTTLNDELQAKYLLNLTAMTVKGGLLYLGVFFDHPCSPHKTTNGPRRMTERQLHELFNVKSGWEIKEFKYIYPPPCIYPQHVIMVANRL